MTVENVLWFVVRGESPGAPAVEPGELGISIPDEVLEWAERHGLREDDPDMYLLVSPADGRGWRMVGEVARMEGLVPAGTVETITDALDAADAEVR